MSVFNALQSDTIISESHYKLSHMCRWSHEPLYMCLSIQAKNAWGCRRWRDESYFNPKSNLFSAEYKYSDCISLPLFKKTIACLQSSAYLESLPAFMSHQCFNPAMRNRSPLFAPLHWQNVMPISAGSNPWAEMAILALLLFSSPSLLSFSHFSVLQRI